MPLLHIQQGRVRLAPLVKTLTDRELQEQMLLLTRGCEALYTQQELERRLRLAAETGRQLRVKLGLDPTSPDIHVGHTVVLRKIRQFQDLGHKAVIIVGDYTAKIGDPTGVNKTRPMLSDEQIDANARTYLEQVSLVLDASPDKLEVRRNSEWLGKLSFGEVLKLAAQITVARMMERDTFELRYKAGIPIGVHELLYPLMQGYDSICIRADIEFGGSDQTFNNLIGRQLQENAGQLPQIVMITPLLVGLDGVEKMSKSKGNYIGITESAREMFGKAMSIPDAIMKDWYRLLNHTFADPLATDRIDALVDASRTHPREAKAALGRMIVETYHGRAAAEAAAAEFDRVFSRKQAPEEMPEVGVPAGAINIVELVSLAGFAKSKSEARRLVVQKAVSLDGAEIADVDARVDPKSGQVLRVGKRRFGKIIVR